jgi:hypothetical protein
VRDLGREDLTALDLVVAGLQRHEGPAPAQAVGGDREVRRAHRPGEDRPRVALRRHRQGHLGVVAIGGPEEGEALRVVPVQVGEQDRAPEGGRAKELGGAADARAGVEQHDRRAAVGGDGHT